MSKHTAGPWETKPENDYVPAQVWADGQLLADVFGESRDVRKANASLIAAAPDLLEAAKTALIAFTAYDRTAEYDWHTHQIKKLEAAIAKAEAL